jgi:DNA replication protein DnaC
MQIKENARSLLLSYIGANADMHISEARNTGMPYDEFLDGLLEREVEQRRANRLQNRMRIAKFPQKKYLVDFDEALYGKKTESVLKSIKTLDFVKNGENVILIGNPGVGKTHLAIALGIEACMMDMRVLFARVPNLLMELREAMSKSQFGAYRKKFEKYDLVVLDELGYVSFDKEGGEILFNLLSNRNDAGSIVITTNLVFERWAEVFKDPILTGALIDRLAHKSYVIDMSRVSVRIQETKKWMEDRVGQN